MSTEIIPRSTARTPTDEQHRALEAVVSVALRSGAGCGKTSVLTDRFIRAIEDRAPLSKLVAVTFTEKAAAEMRRRIRGACRDRIAAGGDDAPYWRKVLRGLEAGRIGTFHGFCLDLLRRFPVQAGLPPEFAVLEASVAPTFRDEALKSCFRRWLADGNLELEALAVDLGLDAVRLGLRDLLSDRGAAAASAWADRSADDLVGHWRSCWESEGRPDLLRALVETARPCLDLLDDADLGHPVLLDRRDVLRTECAMLAEAPDPLLSLKEIKEQARVQGVTAKGWPSREAMERARPKMEQLKAAFECVRAAVEKTVKALAWDEEATRLAAEHGVRFARLAREAIAELDRLKVAREVADFDDLLARARSLLLGGDDDLLARLRSEIDLLLVDEFQDTDPIQGDVVRALAGDDPGAGRLFLVGDSKQSIYRFRGAEPEIFDRFRDALPGDGRLALTGNFRSVSGVIHFVNALFCEMYAEPSEALRPERQVPDEADDPPAVEFLWAYDRGPSPARPTVFERRKLEARAIARTLAERLAAGWPIRDPRTGDLRNAGPADVALLFRALTTVAPYEQAMAEEGLDYHTIDGSAFFAQQEVLDVVNLLAAVEDPLDPLAMAAALRSPFFGVSDAGLFWLANARPEEKPADLLQNLRRREPVAELATADRRRVARARDLLERWRALKDRVPIAALLGRILDESGYEAALVAEPLGDRKRANVRKVARLAARYDRAGYALADFVARLRADLRQLAREDQAATNTETGDAIRLMSIHRAKGLEFPIVVVPDLDRMPPPNSRPVVLHDRLGPIVRPEAEAERFGRGDGERPRSLGDVIYRAAEDRAERAEAERLFYVATTRAISHLILSCGLDSSPEDYAPGAPAMSLLARRFDLATGDRLGPIPDGWPEPRVGVIAASPDRRSARGGPNRKRADRIEIVRSILRTRPDPDTVDTPSPIRPTWVEHDPADGLSPTAALVDRLVRATIADPEARWAVDLTAALDRMANALVPSPSRRIIAAAGALLEPWIVGKLAARVAAADERRGGLAWTVAEPAVGDNRAPTSHRGVLDLAFREGRSWRLVVVEHPDAPAPEAEDRLRRSARAARELGLGRVAGGWVVRLGIPPGGATEFFIDAKRLARADAGGDDGG